MAMMISKFHKLIQSRLLWIGFLVVIVFSFVIWGMVWPSDIDEMERLNAAGLLDGEPVTHGEYRAAFLSTYLGRALTMGRDIPSTPENDILMRQLTWQRLASLREAAKLGIRTSEEELVDAIRANFTDEQGRYLRMQYDAFLQNLIRPMGFSPAQFEHHVREEIILQKLGSLIGRQAHVTPLEIRRTFDTLLDTFTVEYVHIRRQDLEDDVMVSEDEARALFDANPERFTLPEQREVLYAAFPIADFIDPEAEFSDDDLLDFYELNINAYTSTEIGEDGEPRVVVADLADVRDEIVAALRRDAALVAADARATELTFRAIPGRDGTLPDFATEAENAGRPAQRLAPFARTDIPLEDGGLLFTLTAFDLELDAFDRVSAPIAGEEEVYVLYLLRILPPRTPSFEEAREPAMAAARQDALGEHLAARAKAVRDAAGAGLAAGKTLAEAVAPLEAEVLSPAPFTGLSGSASEDQAVRILVQSVVAYNPGELTEPIAAPDGFLVAYVAARIPADPESFGIYRDEIAGTIRNRRAQGLFSDWQQALLAPERFTDLQRQPEPDLEGEEFGDPFAAEEAEMAGFETPEE